MKYEMIFGDQKRFNEQNNEMAEVMLWHDRLGPNFVSIKELSRMNSEGSIPHGSVVLAMRRIIAEPKRWTGADQEAGRLPDVGAKVDGGKVVFVNGFNVVTELKSGAVIVSSPKTFLNTFKPIETPEEKAKRLKDEWCNKAKFVVFGKETALINGPRVCYPLYDALLSGELPTVQAKDGE